MKLARIFQQVIHLKDSPIKINVLLGQKCILIPTEIREVSGCQTHGTAYMKGGQWKQLRKSNLSR